MFEITLFRQGLNQQSAEDFNESLVVFAARISNEFSQAFPMYDAEYFRLSPTWLTLVGCGLRFKESLRIQPDVETWLQSRVTSFFRSF